MRESKVILKRTAPYGASLVVVSSLVYASYGVWITLMGSFFGTFMQALLRSLLVAAFLVPLAMWRREWARIQWRRDAFWLGILAVSSLLIPGPLYYGVLKVGVGLGLAIAYVGIVLGAFFFGWLLNGERYTKDKWISTAFGIAGLWLVFSPSIKTFGLLGLGATLLSGLASGLNMIGTKRIQYDATQSAALTWIASAAVNLAMVLVLRESFPILGLDRHWVYLLLFTAASVTASWTLIRGLKLIEAGVAGILGLLEVVFAVIYGVLFFNERPGGVVLIGMLSIVIAAAIPYMRHYNAQSGTLES